VGSATKRVAVLGASGQLGSDVVARLGASGRYDVVAFSRGDLDVTQRAPLAAALGCGFDIVINCAAFTRVDDCEEEPARALLVNAQGAFEVARACQESRALCVFIGTDYIFDGEKGSPYREDDPARPLNVYGTSKLAGELLVRQAAPRWLVLRVASLFGAAGSRAKGGNFVETILARARTGGELRVVDDIRMSPTYTRDVAAALEELLEREASGVYHASNAGHCTWYELASEALRLLGLAARIEPVPASAYPMRARRPRNSALDIGALQSVLKRPMRPWPEALREYLKEKGYLG
jgi:dTDP-4-dehydrorhamnose reductase